MMETLQALSENIVDVKDLGRASTGRNWFICEKAKEEASTSDRVIFNMKYIWLL